MGVLIINPRSAATAPVIDVPDGNIIEAASADGAEVFYEARTQDAVDDETLQPLNCVPPTGSVFALDDITIVHCTDTDSAGNTATAQFSVSVIDTTAPVLDIPGDVAVETDGPGGSLYSYIAKSTWTSSMASWMQLRPAGGQPVRTRPDGSDLQRGGAHGNKAIEDSFTVRVIDTTKPAQSLPSTTSSPKPQAARRRRVTGRPDCWTRRGRPGRAPPRARRRPAAHSRWARR